MELSQFFKSIIDMDDAPIVICNTEHTIVYMNPAAEDRYTKHTGKNLVGRSLMPCLNDEAQSKVVMVVLWFDEDKANNRVFAFHSEKENCDVYMVALRDDNGKLIGYYKKHEYRTPESGTPYDID